MITKNTKPIILIVFTIIAILAIILSGCSSDKGTAVTTDEEESGTEFALDEKYDLVRNGARLVLQYDKQSNSFKGFVENTTDETLKQVRVEVHLSNGTELGPSTPTDLNPGESIDISLKATDKSFDGWSAHPEVGESGSGEHGNGEEGNEHGNEGGGEHSGGNSG
jgi:hypothetical protein